MRQGDVHAVHPGQHGQGHEDRGDERENLHDLVHTIGLHRQVRVQQAGHAILKERGLVGHPHELVVDVAKAVRHRLGDLGELAPGEPGHRVAFGQGHAAQAGDLRLQPENLLERVHARVVEHRSLDRFEPCLENVHRRPIAVHHVVDDAMQKRNGTFGEHVVMLDAERLLKRDGRRRHRVDGHEQIGGQEEVDVLRLCLVHLLVRHDLVQDQIEKPVVAFDFRMVPPLERVLDRQLMKVEDALQQWAVFLGWSLDVDPDLLGGPGNQPGRVHRLGRAGHAVAMDEHREHGEIMDKLEVRS